VARERLDVALSSQSLNGREGYAELATDYAEVVLRYRLP